MSASACGSVGVSAWLRPQDGRSRPRRRSSDFANVLVVECASVARADLERLAT